MRKDSKVFDNNDSNTYLYKRFAILVTAIILLLAATYYAGLMILPNLYSFWGGSSPNSQSAPEIIPTPYLTSLPQATNSATIKIKGSAPSGLTVQLYINSSQTESQVADNDGQYSFEGNFLRDGENQIYTTAKNQSNQESKPTETQIVNLDQKPPKLEISSPTDNQIIEGEKDKDTFLTVSGKVGESARVTINGNQAIVNDGSFNYRLLLTTTGPELVKIEATDKAGNKTIVEKMIIFNKKESSENKTQ